MFKDNSETYGSFNREQLTSMLQDKLGLEDFLLPWETLCKHTKFDSIATAMALGWDWKSAYKQDMRLLPESHLRIALYNINNFPEVENDQDKL